MAFRRHIPSGNFFNVEYDDEVPSAKSDAPMQTEAPRSDGAPPEFGPRPLTKQQSMNATASAISSRIEAHLPEFLLGKGNKTALASMASLVTVMRQEGLDGQMFVSTLKKVPAAVQAIQAALTVDRASARSISESIHKWAMLKGASTTDARLLSLAYLTLAYHESGLRNASSTTSSARGPLQMLKATRADADRWLSSDQYKALVSFPNLDHSAKQQLAFVMELHAFILDHWRFTSQGWVPNKPFYLGTLGSQFTMNNKSVLQFYWPGMVALMSVYSTNGRSSLRSTASHYPLRPTQDALLFTFLMNNE